MMAPPSTWVALVKDLRGEGRAVRVSAHAEAGFLVVSTWRAGECVSTVRLLPDEAAHLMTGLAEGLAQLAGAPQQLAPATEGPQPEGPQPLAQGPGAPLAQEARAPQPPATTAEPPQPVTATGHERPAESGPDASPDASPVFWRPPS